MDFGRAGAQRGELPWIPSPVQRGEAQQAVEADEFKHGEPDAPEWPGRVGSRFDAAAFQAEADADEILRKEPEGRNLFYGQKYRQVQGQSLDGLFPEDVDYKPPAPPLNLFPEGVELPEKAEGGSRLFPKDLHAGALDGKVGGGISWEEKVFGDGYVGNAPRGDGLFPKGVELPERKANGFLPNGIPSLKRRGDPFPEGVTQQFNSMRGKFAAEDKRYFRDGLLNFRREEELPEEVEDLYSVLGLKDSASNLEIKRAYRKLSLKWHPDKSPAPGADEIFKKIVAAYYALGDPERREKYDTSRPPN